VWKGIDTTLDRPVALKFLSDEFAADPSRGARFEREARLLATLQHANIASVFSVHRVEEAQFLVMELVAGEELSQRLARGPLPMDDAMSIARQIAEALEAAHAAGVVHRDLKPANVKVTPGGQVKVLDFGLAKALGDGRDPVSAADLSLSPTATAGTMAGVIMGTAPYMSPEQAKGRPVDRRTDLWSFGVVLWEMLTGMRLFAGESASEVIAEVLKSDPDFTQLPPDTPPSIRRLLRRCLARDPKARIHDAADARLEIEESGIEEAGGARSAHAAPAAPMWQRLLPWALAAAGVAAAVTLLVSKGPSTAAGTSGLVLFGVPAAAGERLPDEQESILDISSDGREILFIAAGDEGRWIYRRTIDQPAARRIEGTEGASSVFLSPDGRWVGFFVEGSLRKVPIGGGKPVTLTSVPANRGASWGPDGWIAVTPSFDSGISRVPDTGGAPTPLTNVEASRSERTHRWPQVTHDGKWVIFTVGLLDSPGDYDGAAIDAVRLETGERHRVLEGARMARFVPPGYLLFQRESSLLAAPVDPDRMEVIGTPRSLVEGVGGENSSGVGYWAAGSDTLIYALQSAVANDRVVVIVDRSGSETLLPLPPASYWQPRISPDGTRIAVAIGAGAASDDDLWVYDIPRDRFDRLTSDTGNGVPMWSPDGTRIYFTRGGKGNVGIHWKAADGSGDSRMIFPAREGKVLVPESVHPDGKSLIVSESGGSIDLLRLPLDAPESPETLLGEPYPEWGGQFSPDGRYLLYTAIEAHREEVYVRDMAGGGGKWQVSHDGGMFPLWSHDGSEICFIKENRILVASVRTSPSFRSDPPVVLFSGPYELKTFPLRNYDMAADGRFVFLKPAVDGAAPRQVSVTLGWPRLIEPNR